MKKGFTLIEILVSVGLFLVIMTTAMGAILGIINTNRKSESMRVVMDNLGFVMESISREIRFGKNYHCVPTGGDAIPVTSPQDCPSGGSAISFLSQGGRQIIYRLNGATIMDSEDGGVTYIPMTAPEVTITSLNFVVLGSLPQTSGDTLQPKVLIILNGFSGRQAGTDSSFTLETLVSQRILDRT